MKNQKFTPVVRRPFPYVHGRLMDDLVPDYDDQEKLLPLGVHTSVTQCVLIPVQVDEEVWVFFSDIKADRREMKKMAVKQMLRTFPEAVKGVCLDAIPDHYEPTDAELVTALIS